MWCWLQLLPLALSLQDGLLGLCRPSFGVRQVAMGGFSQGLEVFGTQLLATESVPREALLHTAVILAEYLDNDEDGCVDDAQVGLRSCWATCSGGKRAVVGLSLGVQVARKLREGNATLAALAQKLVGARGGVCGVHGGLAPGDMAPRSDAKVMFRDEEEAEDWVEAAQSCHHRPESCGDEFREFLESRWLQDLNADETGYGSCPEGMRSCRGMAERDVALEETLHLIHGAGYALVYPSAFGMEQESLLKKAVEQLYGDCNYAYNCCSAGKGRLNDDDHDI